MPQPNTLSLLRQFFVKYVSVSVALLLAVGVASIYVRVYDFAFISLDDRSYLVNNSHIKNGLTWDGLRWAFTSVSRSNWFPLTWISHMIDVSLYGLAPGGHHVTNVAIHSLSTALLFLALRRMTGAVGASAFAAALFGIHPLHVESVAWVAERKDVLSGFFFMLIMLAYNRYVRRGGALNYLVVLFLFAMGLMSKPMLVTVPFVLLLLDVWPLGRTGLAAPEDASPWNPLPWSRLVLEKTPLILLSAGSSILTLIAQRRTISSLDSLPFDDRLSNALVSSVTYLAKTLWPASLAVYYPYPETIALWKSLGAAALLLAMTLAVLLQFRRRPFLAVGWFWFLLMLVPVIGLVQVGRQAMADRYTYLPLIGPFILAVWGAAGAVRSGPLLKKTVPAASLALLAVLAVITFHQIGYWKNGIVLFEHTLAVTGSNYQAHNGLATELSLAGRNREAIPHFFASLRMDYENAETHRNLAFAFEDIREMDHAVFHMREAFRIDPGDSIAYFSLQYYLSQRK